MGLFTRNSTPEQHVADEAARFVKSVAKGGHRDDAASLDFSPASVGTLDAVIARHRGDVDADGVPDAVSLGAACYFFETVRREYGGRLCSGSGDDPLVLVVGEPDFCLCVPAVSKVVQRTGDAGDPSLQLLWDDVVVHAARREDATLS
ncbi:hypothetical protein ES689_02890 [Frigoribacterium sp. ACAM 257]|uniref:hypothetical protein n=1 Tax=Frigoribacterium sp. ACAM 257 TaxID=2508998 RepID=UPI0011B9B96C|nr:hypothetical protein [Frigoribacterium sp. ACAM 257]TWX40420.1 hypothetical protein ES689_02890 [Frigoribacterium sp. ACAM 257]